MAAKANITTRTIADAAGVNQSTVSRALRNDPRLPSETLRRVAEVAERLGYRANPLVSAWLAHRRGSRSASPGSVIAFVHCFTDPLAWKKITSFRRFLEGARRQAEILGYGFEEFVLGAQGLSAERMMKVFSARGIQGALIGAPASATAHLRLAWDFLAPVAQGLALRKPDISRASAHHSYAMQTALREVRRLGYRRMGLAINAAVNARTDYVWEAELLAFQQKLASKDRVPALISPNWGEQAFRDWFLKNRPDVILTCHALVKGWIAGLGCGIPADVGLVHLDRHPENTGWAGVDQRGEMIGSAAIDLVSEQLVTNRRGVPENPKLVIIKGEWIPGESIRRVGAPTCLVRLRRGTGMKVSQQRAAGRGTGARRAA